MRRRMRPCVGCVSSCCRNRRDRSVRASARCSRSRSSSTSGPTQRNRSAISRAVASRPSPIVASSDRADDFAFTSSTRERIWSPTSRKTAFSSRNWIVFQLILSLLRVTTENDPGFAYPV